MLGLVFVISLFAVAPAQAAPGALNVLVTGNEINYATNLANAIKTESGVASAAPFDTSVATPVAETLAPYDLIVSTGDYSYFDAALWGD